MAELGVLDEDPARLRSLAGRIELLLWKFLQMRWYDAPLFFSSLSSDEAMDVTRLEFCPGNVYRFFLDRQDERGWENSMTVGLSLICAAMRQAVILGTDPRQAGSFTLLRMMEQALSSVQTMEDLLKIGAPP